jgi:hypothetical protein
MYYRRNQQIEQTREGMRNFRRNQTTQQYDNILILRLYYNLIFTNKNKLPKLHSYLRQEAAREAAADGMRNYRENLSLEQ